MANNQLALNITAKTDSVTEVAVTRAETLLRAVKAKYIIQLPDGSVISQGGLELVVPKLTKRQRRDPSVPYGSYTSLICACGFDQMQVGDVITIDTTGFDAESVRGVVSARASKLWGNKSSISSVKGSMIEVLRVQ
jgi:hypothetical protein